MRRLLVGLVAVLGLLAGGALFARPPSVPEEAIRTAVTRTPALMEQAFALPVAASFGRDLTWQSNASRCGPASVANVYRSMGEEETTEAAVLDGTGLCWTGWCIIGLTLDELAGVAQAHTERKVTVLRDLTEDAFLDHLRRANDPSRRYIINFRRKEIFGAGAGHHSPIGGYLEKEDLVLVLDVNEAFKPWLVERKRLYDAMNTLDGEKKRGMLVVE
ncbi:phytochelatin synthase family protein [Mesorhizobium sp. ZC-5]|uniref:phytochelatin synthase family protein n=1 Tax=Mesorhizobium sp. ZC-5 TaxID=2986066 RepID=UPI0021E729E1|nr:phytochelatin synthase family protein [Mesorhizobium sp. ZC-5]MCV3241043.1 phytochelatin synthase family protein [Mesorhizobium sp. ZC-5]